MTQQPYTSIPDTSDTNYWTKTVNEQDRSVSFKPINKELHRELKEKTRKPVQPKQPYRVAIRKGRSLCAEISPVAT